MALIYFVFDILQILATGGFYAILLNAFPAFPTVAVFFGAIVFLATTVIDSNGPYHWMSVAQAIVMVYFSFDYYFHFTELLLKDHTATIVVWTILGAFSVILNLIQMKNRK